MIIRNAVKSNIRARGRSLLFFALIFLLTLAIILSFGVRLYCSNILEQCDTQYHSIALVDYMGADYPAADVVDEAARNAAKDVAAMDLSSVEGVKRWTPYSSWMGYLDSYERKNSSSVYSSMAVLEVRGLYPYYRQYWMAYSEEEFSAEAARSYLSRSGQQWALELSDEEIRTMVEIEGITGEYHTDESEPFYYTARISRVLYGTGVKAETLINVVPAYGFKAEKNDAFYINARNLGKNAYGIMNSIPVFEICSFADGSTDPYEKIEGNTPASEQFLRSAQYYSVANNYIWVDYFSELEDIYEFNQGEVYLKEGDLNIETDLPVCVVSEDIASQCGFSVGDEIDLNELVSAEDSIYELSLSGKNEKLKIAAISNMADSAPGHIWIKGERPDSTMFGYHIGTLTLDNSTAMEVAESLQQMMPQNVRVALYDQGYQDAVRPFVQMRAAAENVFFVTCFASVAVLFLFAYLFITRQQQSVKIMRSLGTPKSKMVLFLLSGSVLISFAGCALGAVCGRIALPYAFNAVNNMVSSGKDVVRFSETMLGVTKQAVLDPPSNMSPVWICSLAMLAASVIFCAAFLPTAFRESTLKKGVSRVRIPNGKTSVKGAGSLRFAALSMSRGGLRSLVVPLVCLILTVVVVFLGSIFNSMRSSFTESLKNTETDGIAVSYDGRYYSRLAIPVTTLQKLAKIENMDGIYISQDFSYWMPSEMPQFGGGEFSQESRMAWIKRQPRVVACNSFKGASDFYYSEAVAEWLEGWDESFLADPSYSTIYEMMDNVKVSYDPNGNPVFELQQIPAVVGDDFASDHGLELGDSFSIYILEDRRYNVEIPLKMQIAGIYHQAGGRAQIYIPLACITPYEAIYEPEGYEPPANRYLLGNMSEEERNKYYYYKDATFSTFRFTLGSTDALEKVRGYLWDSGYSAVGTLRSVRTFIILRDASYIKLTEAMNKFISTGRIVISMIAVALVLIGFIISWLMIHTRKREFALMRGFGAGKGRIFFSFFLEQAMLCIAGCLPGCLALLFVKSGSTYALYAVAAYIVCYLLGAALAIAATNRTRLMDILSYRE